MIHDTSSHVAFILVYIANRLCIYMIHDTSSHVAFILVYIAKLLLREHGHRPVNTLGMDCKRNFVNIALLIFAQYLFQRKASTYLRQNH